MKLLIPCCLIGMALIPACAGASTDLGMPFLFSAEFIGPDPQTSPVVQAFAREGVVNALKFWPPLSDETLRWVKAEGLGFTLWCPGSDEIRTRMKGLDRLDKTVLGEERAKVQALTGTLGRKAWWDVMPEFDQSGGNWVAGRPSPEGLTRRQACEAWRSFYLGLQPLGIYLRQTPAQRGFNLAATSVYAFSAHYAYEMGVELLLLERDNDDIGDLQTGTAFLRGAARQYGRPWGIDISEWRDLSDAPTAYDDHMRQVSGWSLSYHKRHLYLSYMAGANVIQLEAMGYQTGGELNPFGRLVEEFGDFALRRHKDVGRPVVTTALMLDHDHGFEPRFGRWCQGDYVWYWKLPYSDGDYMTHNMLNLLFPGYWRSGTLVPGAPTTPQAYNAALVAGADPRPWEPMGESTWGDQFDVLLSDAQPSALRQYKTILLVGGIELNPKLQGVLRPWVEGGGTLVVNAAQAHSADPAFLGCRLSSEERVASASEGVADHRPRAEPTYSYAVATPGQANILARTPSGDPLVVENRIGRGTVVTALPRYLMDQAKTQVLNVGRRLVDTLVRPGLPATVSGPFPVEYIVSARPDAVIVTVCNNSGQTWEGRIAARKPGQRCRVREWLSDTAVPYRETDGEVAVSVRVPAYDLRVFAVETDQ
jgi:hypothetical protein